MLDNGLSSYPALFSSASVAAASVTGHLNYSGELYQMLAKINSYVISRKIRYNISYMSYFKRNDIQRFL